VKINQYCSVCKKHLDMEVIPTDDAGDDGVIWLRCPECKGFLPKFSGEGLKRPPATAEQDSRTADARSASTAQPDAGPTRRRAQTGAPARPGAMADAGTGSTTEPPADRDSGLAADRLPADEPADGPRDEPADEPQDDSQDELQDESVGEAAAAAGRAAAAAEPIAEYAARLAEADLAAARPYRSTAAYAVGDVIHHLAYDDIGVVVAKESLPGGRLAVKVFFEKAGVVRLIEQATDGA
jgi:hypothetical protein